MAVVSQQDRYRGAGTILQPVNYDNQYAQLFNAIKGKKVEQAKERANTKAKIDDLTSFNEEVWHRRLGDINQSLGSWRDKTKEAIARYKRETGEYGMYEEDRINLNAEKSMIIRDAQRSMQEKGQLDKVAEFAYKNPDKVSPNETLETLNTVVDDKVVWNGGGNYWDYIKYREEEQEPVMLDVVTQEQSYRNKQGVKTTRDVENWNTTVTNFFSAEIPQFQQEEVITSIGKDLGVSPTEAYQQLIDGDTKALKAFQNPNNNPYLKRKGLSSATDRWQDEKDKSASWGWYNSNKDKTWNSMISEGQKYQVGDPKVVMGEDGEEGEVTDYIETSASIDIPAQTLKSIDLNGAKVLSPGEEVRYNAGQTVKKAIKGDVVVNDVQYDISIKDNISAEDMSDIERVLGRPIGGTLTSKQIQDLVDAGYGNVLQVDETYVYAEDEDGTTYLIPANKVEGHYTNQVVKNIGGDNIEEAREYINKLFNPDLSGLEEGTQSAITTGTGSSRSGGRGRTNNSASKPGDELL